MGLLSLWTVSHPTPSLAPNVTPRAPPRAPLWTLPWGPSVLLLMTSAGATLGWCSFLPAGLPDTDTGNPAACPPVPQPPQPGQLAQWHGALLGSVLCASEEVPEVSQLSEHVPLWVTSALVFRLVSNQVPESPPHPEWEELAVFSWPPTARIPPSLEFWPQTVIL